MKAGMIGTRRQAILFGALALVLLFALVRWSGREKPVAPPPLVTAPPADEADGRTSRGRRSRGARAVSPDEVPLITSRDLEPRLRGSGADTGRDLFDFREPTPVPPPRPTPEPPPPPGPGDPRFVGPLPPPGPTPTPTPPEPTFKLIGIFGPRDRPIAVLNTGDEVINARAGEVVLGRWIIRRVGYESIEIGFVGFAPTETRRLPITQ